MLVNISDDKILDLICDRGNEYTDVNYRYRESLKFMYEAYVYNGSFDRMKYFFHRHYI